MEKKQELQKCSNRAGRSIVGSARAKTRGEISEERESTHTRKVEHVRVYIEQREGD